MSLFSRFFGPAGESARQRAQLEERLRQLEAEAQTAGPGYVGTAYNRAGDVTLKGGDAERAVGYYGRAIDAYLADEQPEAARGVANKIIRVRPHAVRTLCTLTWLDLAARHTGTALVHLRDYVTAAQKGHRDSHAAGQIFEMAKVVPDREVLGALAAALETLDFRAKAAQVREWEAAGGSPAALKDAKARAATCVIAAARSNERTGV